MCFGTVKVTVKYGKSYTSKRRLQLQHLTRVNTRINYFFALAISASFLYFFLYENFVNIYTIRIRPFWDDPSLALLQHLGLSSTFPFSISFAGSETTSSLATVWVLVVVQSPSFRAWTDIFRVQIFLPVREAAHAWRLCVFCGNAGYRAKRRENTSVLGIPPQFFSDLLVLHLNTEIHAM